jgi:hypothetical protein
MQKSLAPDTSLDIDQCELRRIRKGDATGSTKKTDSRTSDQLTKFDCHPLKNIQHLLFELLML